MINEMVSIVIPCYNQSELLPVAVESCLNQTYQNIEIIVVDDGSPDNVESALIPYKDSIKLIKQTNKGLSRARNTGLMASKGKFIKFLDSDDWLLPDCISQQASILQGLNLHIAISGYRLYFQDETRIEENIFPDIGRLKYSLCYVNTGPPHTFMYTTKSILDIDGFRTDSIVDGGHEDYDLVCRLSVKGYEAIVLHTIGCVYRQTESSMSKHTENMRKTRKNVWESYILNLLANDCSLDLLSHMMGGYALRSQSEDIRFDFVYALEIIIDKIIKINDKKFPLSTTLSILNNIANILTFEPCPKTPYEKKQKIQLNYALKKLLFKIYRLITNKVVINMDPIEIISRSAAISAVHLNFHTGLLIFNHAKKIKWTNNSRIYISFLFYLIVEILRKILKTLKK